MKERQISRTASRALLFAAVGSFACFLTLAVVVALQGFDPTDQLVRSLVRGSADSLWRSVMVEASVYGGEAGQVPLIALGCVALWRRRRRWSVALPIVMAGAGLLQLAAKWGFDRPRPNLDPWGFPSAHVLSLVVLLGYLAFVIATSDGQRSWRRLGLIACGAALATVAYSRMFLDAHWLSDVLGGFSIGLAYLFVTIWWINSTSASADPFSQNRAVTEAMMNGPASTSIRLKSLSP